MSDKMVTLASLLDANLGKISILRDPATNELLMLKEQEEQTHEGFRLHAAQLEIRKKLACPFIPALVSTDLRPDAGCGLIRAFFEYSPLQLSHLHLLNIETAVKLCSDLFGAAAFLQDRSMFHGDIRPELVAFYPEQRVFKLCDKILNDSYPTVSQFKHIEAGDQLFLSPKYFNEIINNKTEKLHYDYFKNESFAIGMITLQAMFPRNFVPVEFYNKKLRLFEKPKFHNLLRAFLHHAHSPLERTLLLFLSKHILCINEKKRLKPKEAYQKLEEITREHAPEISQNLSLKIDSRLKQKISFDVGFRQLSSFVDDGVVPPRHPLIVPSLQNLPNSEEPLGGIRSGAAEGEEAAERSEKPATDR